MPDQRRSPDAATCDGSVECKAEVHIHGCGADDDCRKCVVPDHPAASSHVETVLSITGLSSAEAEAVESVLTERDEALAALRLANQATRKPNAPITNEWYWQAVANVQRITRERLGLNP